MIIWIILVSICRSQDGTVSNNLTRNEVGLLSWTKVWHNIYRIRCARRLGCVGGIYIHASTTVWNMISVAMLFFNMFSVKRSSSVVWCPWQKDHLLSVLCWDASPLRFHDTGCRLVFSRTRWWLLQDDDITTGCLSFYSQPSLRSWFEDPFTRYK